MITTTESPFVLFLCVLLGVVVSIVIPAARKATTVPLVEGDWIGSFWGTVKPYVPWAILALTVSIAIVFLMTLTDIRAAFVAGYAWDSTLQKASGKP